MKFNLFEILSELLNSESSEIRRKSCWIVSNILGDNINHSILLDENYEIIEKIISILSFDEFTVYICSLYYNIINFGFCIKKLKLYLRINNTYYFMINKLLIKVKNEAIICIYNILFNNDDNQYEGLLKRDIISILINCLRNNNVDIDYTYVIMNCLEFFLVFGQKKLNNKGNSIVLKIESINGYPIIENLQLFNDEEVSVLASHLIEKFFNVEN